MMTAWPSQGTATSSTTPLFMMIPYPSSSPKPINVTRINRPDDITGMIVGGTAVGALGIGSAYVLLRYLRPKKKQQQTLEEELTAVTVGTENVTHLCVSSSDLEEIKQILNRHNKRWMVLEQK